MYICMMEISKLCVHSCNHYTHAEILIQNFGVLEETFAGIIFLVNPFKLHVIIIHMYIHVMEISKLSVYSCSHYIHVRFLIYNSTFGRNVF